MNLAVIFLGVVVIILILFLYMYFTQSSTTVTDSINLNTDTKTISSKTLPLMSSPRYSYGFWIYINSWTPSHIWLLAHYGELGVFLNGTNPTLNGVVKSGSSFPVVSVPNIPIQKWTHYILSVNDNFLDVYIDGKLAKTVPITSSPGPVSTDLIVGYGTKPDIYLAKVMRWGQTMDPQTALNTYLAGYGSSMINYNAMSTVIQNGKITAQNTLF